MFNKFYLIYIQKWLTKRIMYKTNYGECMNKKNVNKIILLAISGVILIFAITACSSTTDSESKSASSEDTSTTKNNESSTSAQETQNVGIYQEYATEKVTNAKTSDKVILFFHASWCSTCQSIERDINANLDSIPADVKILKVDYDSEDDLKDKYGVRQQYTMVQVDNSGEKIKLWNDSFSLDDILDTAV